MMMNRSILLGLVAVVALATGAAAFRLDLAKMAATTEYGSASTTTPLDDSLDREKPVNSDKTAPPAHQGRVFMCRITPKDKSNPVREYELSVGDDQTEETSNRVKECQGGGSGRHAANLIEGHGDHSSDFNVAIDIKKSALTHDILVTNNRFEAVVVDMEVAGQGILANPPSPMSMLVDARANGKLITSLTRTDVEVPDADKLPADVFSSEKDMKSGANPKGKEPSASGSGSAAASSSSSSAAASESTSGGSKIAPSDASKSKWPSYTWKWKAEKVEFSQKERTVLVSSNGVTVKAVHKPFQTLFTVDNARPHDVVLTFNVVPLSCRGSSWDNLHVPASVPKTMVVPGNKNFVRGFKPPANVHPILGVEPVHKDKPWSFDWTFHWYSRDNAPHTTFGVANPTTGEFVKPAHLQGGGYQGAVKSKKCNPKVQQCPDGMVRGTPKPLKSFEGLLPLPVPPVKFYPQKAVPKSGSSSTSGSTSH